jgi:hypothetical protein
MAATTATVERGKRNTREVLLGLIDASQRSQPVENVG